MTDTPNPTLVLASDGRTFAVNQAPQPEYLNLCSRDGSAWLHVDLSGPSPVVGWVPAAKENQTPAVQWAPVGTGYYRCAPSWPAANGVAVTVKILGPAPTSQG